jgi:Osmosensitive K+ channel histidine kinase
MAITPEVLIPRLGDILVEQGKITVEQLQQALEYQKQERLKGRSPLIGQVLVEMEILDQETVTSSITQQILVLQTNLREANESLERKVQERTQELEKAYSKLSELSQLKANFVANISHELRTPLTHISGYVELLLTDKVHPLPPEQRQSVEVIQRASLRLERLINDLILFTNSESGKLTIDNETFDPRFTLQEVVEHAQEAAQKKNITLSSQVETQQLKINTDRSKLKWVLNQLLDNAIKYTRDGGKVSLSLQEKAEHFVFAVTDTGIGIPADKLSDIFEQFYQLDGSSTRAQGGTGLGLSLVKSILNALGTDIHVESELGKGSCFSFELNKA